jgi:hypothetical protein
LGRGAPVEAMSQAATMAIHTVIAAVYDMPDPRGQCRARGRGQPDGEVDMLQVTAKLVLLLLRLVIPASGRHRAHVPPPTPRRRHVPPLPRYRRRPEVPLCGDASELIRPYALTPEEFRQRWTRYAKAGAAR